MTKLETAEAHNMGLVGKFEHDTVHSAKLTMMMDKTIAEVKAYHGMGMKEYQRLAQVTVVYPQDLKVIYPLIGLCGETGEVAEKIKKWIRDADRKPMTQEQLDLLKKELDRKSVV